MSNLGTNLPGAPEALALSDAKPALSVIVPVYNEASNLLQSLRHFQSLRKLGAQLIIVDGGSTDTSQALLWQHRDYWDHCLVSAPGRARQMNAGASLASAESLLFLHVDSKLDGDFSIAEITRQTQRGRWGYCRLRLSEGSWLFNGIAASINWRSMITGSVTGDQGFWLSKRQFDELGGYPDIPLMEDIALCDQLKRRHRGVRLNYWIETSSRRWQKHGVLKTICLMWWFRLLYRCGYSAWSLAQRYYPHIEYSVDTSSSARPLADCVASINREGVVCELL